MGEIRTLRNHYYDLWSQVCAPLPCCLCRVQEYVDGQLKNKYGDCFIRGNNVLYISTAKN